MLVYVSSRLPGNEFGASFEQAYHDLTFVQTVVDDFAKRFSLPVSQCTAWHTGTKLDHSKPLREVAGERSSFTIAIAFTPSLAFYIWQSFRKGLWRVMRTGIDVSRVWEVVAQTCCTDGLIAESMADTARLSALLAADPLQTFPVDRLLYQSSSDAEGPCVLPHTNWPGRQMLLFAQLLALAAAQHKTISPSWHELQRGVEAQNTLMDIITSKLQMLTNASNCILDRLSAHETQLHTQDQTDQLADLQKEGGAQAQTQALAHAQRQPHTELQTSHWTEHPQRTFSEVPDGLSVLMLRCALLVSKLAALMFNVKADLVGHDDPGMPPAIVALWHLLSVLSTRVERALQAEQGSPSSGIQANTGPAACSERARQPDSQEQHLCLPLCRLLVGVLRQCTKEPKAGTQVMSCFDMLRAVLSTCQSEQLMADMLKAGALPVLVAYLDVGTSTATWAVECLHHLCCSDFEACHQNLELLVRLQGVRRLSNTLCPRFQVEELSAPETAAAVFSAPTFKSAESDSQEDRIEDVQTMSQAADLMHRLLTERPLSHRPRPGTPDAPEAVIHPSALHMPLSDAPPVASCPDSAESWPTPKPAQWQDIQLVAARACVCLEWITEPNVLPLEPQAQDQTPSREQQHKEQLIQQLCTLLDQLIAGHVLDMHLDMQKLFTTALFPILRAQTDGHAQSSMLATAVLSRLALDTALLRDALAPRPEAKPEAESAAATERQLSIAWAIAWAVIRIFSSGVLAPKPTALMKAATIVLHFAVAVYPAVMQDQIRLSCCHALHCHTDSRSEFRLMVFACVGALLVSPAPSRDMSYASARWASQLKLDPYDASLEFRFKILIRLLVQLPKPWDAHLCPAAAVMLHRCCHKSLVQCHQDRPHDTQELLVQLLQQLRECQITEDARLQRLLLTGCCRCLQNLFMQEEGNAANFKGVAPAIADCFVYFAAAPRHVALCDAMPVSFISDNDSMSLIQGMPGINHVAVLGVLTETVTPHLDNQEMWQGFTLHGLRHLLHYLCSRAWTAEKLKVSSAKWLGRNLAVKRHLDLLSTASKHGALRRPHISVQGSDVVPVPAESDTNVDLLEIMLSSSCSEVELWRKAACAAVVLVALSCELACQLQQQRKTIKQDMLKLRQKAVSAQDSKRLTSLQADSAELLLRLQTRRQQLEEMLPALATMQKEPAWSAIMADHQKEDWPLGKPPQQIQQDLMYLAAEKLLSEGTVQAVQSFCFFMLGESNAAAAAAVGEQLMAAEAMEAAKAAAKKAKRQKAKARKQQPAATSTGSANKGLSPSAAVPGLADQQEFEPAAAELQQTGISAQNESQKLPLAQDPLLAPVNGTGQPGADQFAVPSQDDVPSQDAAVRHQVAFATTETAIGLLNGAAPADDAGQASDAHSLDQLFCCPITKVCMVDPVIAADGHTYEHSALEHWLQGSCLSPVTGERLTHTRLVPNVLVKSALAQHTQDQRR